MTTLTGKIIADFETSLATSIAIGGTSATLQSATDDDSVALPSGVYYFTIDGSNSSKEHIKCSLSGTAITSIQSISRQGAVTSGVVRAHRIGATVTLTDFAHIKVINDLINGTVDLDSSVPLKYDGTATISNDAHLATKKYVDDTAVSGAPNANTTTKGIVEEATQAEVDARTTTGGTGAKLFAPLDKIRASMYYDYAADAGANDTYVVTLVPAATAYVTGMFVTFKANTANTGACTLNVNGLGVKSLKMNKDLDPVDGYIKAGQDVTCVYDGTNFQITSVSGKPSVSQTGGEIYATDVGSNDTYAITLSPAPTAYTTGMVVRFKANTVNTGAATLNVNSLGAVSIFRVDGSALASGDISASQIVEVVYDGTNFRVISTAANTPKYAQGFDNSWTMATASGNLVIPHGLGRTPRKVRITSYIDYGSPAGTPTKVTQYGVYDGTNIASVVGTGSIINMESAGGSPHTQSATITVDSTNITLAFTRGGTNGTETISIVWEAEC